jgi:hypothetical protein
MRLPVVPTIAAVALCVPTVWGSHNRRQRGVRPTSGLQLGVAASVGGSAVAVDVSFRNTGANDFVLNLGHMLANGKVMFPDAVQVILTRPSGTT